MKDKRRLIIIVVSVLIGTMLSVLLVMGKKGRIDSNDKFMLATNFVFGLAIVIAIGVVMKRMDNKKEKENK